jgi:hypothetical protein
MAALFFSPFFHDTWYPAGIMGKKWKKQFLMVFPPGKAHQPGLYQNIGHTLSSQLRGPLFG